MLSLLLAPSTGVPSLLVFLDFEEDFLANEAEAALAQDSSAGLLIVSTMISVGFLSPLSFLCCSPNTEGRGEERKEKAEVDSSTASPPLAIVSLLYSMSRGCSLLKSQVAVAASLEASIHSGVHLP